MEVLVLLIPVSVLLVLLIGAVFWWSVRSGQFDDLDGPAHRILADDDTSDAIPGAPAAPDDSRRVDGRIDFDQTGARITPLESRILLSWVPDQEAGGARGSGCRRGAAHW